MQNFSDFINTVNEMMSDFGAEAIYTTQIDLGEYDPLTATSSVSVSDIPITAILMDLTLRSNGMGTKDKTLIVDGDKILYVRPTDYLLPILMPGGTLSVDTSDDRVTIGGAVYKVVTMKSLNPTGSTQPILFELYLRR